ncbi:hypothetical protein Ahy_A03g016089 isoform B [Arachis hypogaea]|uniref:Uncharacterized protein n=1 Tax=Arachis hypogaea TaxID=3818 RepID=A0A445E284_ARAHY|nr:hypothetical protein Ahy_A03g016089 isoform B [Arachis hypogaea]
MILSSSNEKVKTDWSIPDIKICKESLFFSFVASLVYCYREGGGGGVDFLAGFLMGGAILGTAAYIFAPQHGIENFRFPNHYFMLASDDARVWKSSWFCVMQIRRSLLNENEYGFRKAKRPMYYDGRLERTRQTLNRKITQLNDAIDNVSSRLRRGNNNVPTAKMASDPEVEANM